MLIALHKPYGVLSQFTAEVAGQRTLAEFGLPKGVYAAGRLDRDSEGLLLLTDESGTQARLTHPRAGTVKRYLAQVEGNPGADQLQRLRGGVEVRINKRIHTTAQAGVGQVARPDFPQRDPPVRYRERVPTAWLHVDITEGKNRQVRRMCAAVGLPVLRLIRIAVGPYALDDLPAGRWRVC